MKALYRLKAKKAFTLVELIVVMAIIAVLAGIMFPLFSGAGKPQEAAAKAKSFYFMAQDIFIDYKAEKPTKADGEPYLIYKRSDGSFVESVPVGASVNAAGSTYISVKNTDLGIPTYLTVYAKAEKDKGFTEVKVCTNYEATADRPEETLLHLYTNGVVSDELKDKFNTYAQPEDEGYYYALVDRQCRVIMTYWSRATVENLIDKRTTGGTTFVNSTATYTSMDNIGTSYNGTFIVGSYPAGYSAEGCVMFKYNISGTPATP